MNVLAFAMCVFGVALLAAGAWWLWGGRARWLPATRFQRAASEPTRVLVGVAHLVLGYHLLIWNLPVRDRALHIPRQHWSWLVLGCAAAVGGSIGLDRLDTRRQGEEGRSEP